MARSVFGECLLEIDKKGYDVVLQIHDEVVVEVPTSEAETAAKEVESIMSKSPKWAPTLPVSADSQIVTCYKK
jgi:DNA polymerase